jgi:siroheme synthase
LRANNIPFEIVPGVTSAMGAAAVAQIPLTHRRASDALVLITAHRAADKSRAERDAADWRKLATSGATLVIYMPGQNYVDISSRLRAAGLAGDTPCAIISRATTRHQRTHRTTVRDLNRAPQLVSPTLLVVGDVVSLSDTAAMAAEFVVPDLARDSKSINAQVSDKRIPAVMFNDLDLEIPLAGSAPESR